MNNRALRKNGFTLVEMIVALALFITVSVVALGALMKIISANKKAQTLQSALTNLNFALETMSREMRMGTTYYCDKIQNNFNPNNKSSNACPNSGYNMIAFKSAKIDNYNSNNPCNLWFAYLFDAKGTTPETWTLKKAEQTECHSGTQVLGSNPNDFIPVISDNIAITGYKMQVDNVSSKYPIAFIYITGYAGTKEKDRTYFSLQTAASARIQ